MIERGPFGEISSTSVTHEQPQARDGVLAFAQSVSWIAHRPDEERGQIMRDLVAEGPFAFPLRTEVNWTVRA